MRHMLVFLLLSGLLLHCDGWSRRRRSSRRRAVVIPIPRCGGPPSVSLENMEETSAPRKFYNVQELLNYTCQTGHYFEGTANQTTFTTMCQANGTWQRVPLCIAGYCPPLESQHPTIVTYTSRRAHGSRALYTCAHGYRLHGDRSRTCVAVCAKTFRATTITSDCSRDMILFWNSSAPDCNAVLCPRLSIPYNGRLHFAPNEESLFQYNNTVTTMCFPGYVLTGSERRTCLGNGEWNGTEARCEAVTCPIPSLVLNGWIRTRTWTFGSQYTVGCNEGYHRFNQTGPRTRRCQSNRLWSGASPQCQAIDCGIPQAGNHVITNYSSTLYSSEAEHACPLGYIKQPERPSVQICWARCPRKYIDGRHYPVCQQATADWSGSPPVCTPGPCTAVQPPNNGSIAQYSLNGHEWISAAARGFRGLEGMRVQFVCDIGFKLRVSSDGVRLCGGNGIWSGSEPRCADVCDGVSCPEGLKCVDHPSERNSHQCICKMELECVPTVQSVCASNAVTYASPCHALSYACRSNRSLTVVRKETCERGPKCVPPQQIPQQMNRSNPTSDKGYVFDSSLGRCRRTTGKGQGTSDWLFASDQLCRSVCHDVDPCTLQNDSGPCVNFTTRYYFNTSSRQCQPFDYGGCFGNENNFHRQEECEQCVNSRCPFPENPSHGRRIGRRRFVNSQVQFTCAAGYNLRGVSSRQCLPNLSWSGSPVTCESASPCPPHYCRFLGAMACSINRNTVTQSCSQRALGDTEFAIKAIYNSTAAASHSCFSSVPYSTFQMTVEEVLNTSSTCGLTLKSNVWLRASHEFQCPCPRPIVGTVYLITGRCVGSAAGSQRELTLHQQSLFQPDSPATRSGIQQRCGW